jgi:hypothetical protein
MVVFFPLAGASLGACTFIGYSFSMQWAKRSYVKKEEKSKKKAASSV